MTTLNILLENSIGFEIYSNKLSLVAMHFQFEKNDEK